MFWQSPIFENRFGSRPAASPALYNAIMREDTTGAIGMLFQASGASVGVGACIVLLTSSAVGRSGIAMAVAVAGTDVGTRGLVAVAGALWVLPHSGVSQAASKTSTRNNKRFFCVFMDNSAEGWFVPRARSKVPLRPASYGWRCW